MNEDEKELLDMIISERIDTLLRQMKHTEKTEAVSQLINQAEAIMADEGTCLYSAGFIDGIRVLKLINSL